MPTPGGLPKRGDRLTNDMYPNVLFKVTERTSPTVPFIAWIQRVDGKELPPRFGTTKTRNTRHEYALLWETPEMPGQWHFVDPVQPAPAQRPGIRDHIIPRETGTAIGRPKYTLELDRESETYEFVTQRRVPTIPSRSQWEDYMEPHNTPDSAFGAVVHGQALFNERVEWRVVLKRTTVEIVHRIS